VKNVIFDIGGVLVDWRPYEIAAHFFPDETARNSAVDNILRHPDWQTLDKGIVTWDELLPRFAQRSGLAPARIREIMDFAFDSVEPKQDTLDLATELKKTGAHIFCLSDMPAVTYDVLKRKFTFFDLFDGLVISSQVKMTKQEPESFRHILNTFSLDPHETAFIDDLPRNIQMAETFGIKGILFTTAAAARRQLVCLGFSLP